MKFLILCMIALGLGAPALAADVPLDIGVGPAAHWIPGAVGADQAVHMGLVVSVQAVVDRRTLNRFAPERARNLMSSVDEVRVSPFVWLPDTVYISPKLSRTAMWGASWRPLSIGVPIVTGPIRAGVDVGPRLTALYIQSDALPTAADPKATFFLRPGVDLQGEVEFELSDTLLLSVGANSQVYLPQALGGFGLGSKGARMWMINQAFIKLHVRVPYTLDL